MSEDDARAEVEMVAPDLPATGEEGVADGAVRGGEHVDGGDGGDGAGTAARADGQDAAGGAPDDAAAGGRDADSSGGDGDGSGVERAGAGVVPAPRHVALSLRMPGSAGGSGSASDAGSDVSDDVLTDRSIASAGSGVGSTLRSSRPVLEHLDALCALWETLPEARRERTRVLAETLRKGAAALREQNPRGKSSSLTRLLREARALLVVEGRLGGEQMSQLGRVDMLLHTKLRAVQMRRGSIASLPDSPVTPRSRSSSVSASESPQYMKPLTEHPEYDGSQFGYRQKDDWYMSWFLFSLFCMPVCHCRNILWLTTSPYRDERQMAFLSMACLALVVVLIVVMTLLR